MTRLTLELPDIMVERLQVLASVEGKDINNYTVTQLKNFLETDEIEAILGIQRGLTELDAGEGQPLDEFHTEMMAKIADRKAKSTAAK